jgi:NAD(P)-dependent dehydrogenase (short-subunit alcohol dehydrogenase family)
LGYECAKTIAKANQGWHVLMACRSTHKGTLAKEKLVNDTGNSELSVLELDLASLQSVRNFVSMFEKLHLPPLHGLINNAGMQVMNGLEYTKDGYEITFATNHLGHFLLTNLLIDKFAKPARVIIVSSGTHDPNTTEGKFNAPMFLGATKLAKPTSDKEMTGLQRYSTSKLSNLLFGYELARRTENMNIAANAFDPGAVPATNLLQSIKNPFARGRVKASTKLFQLMGFTVSTPEISGSAMARLLLDEKLEHTTGKYFQILVEKQSSQQSYDAILAAELWKDSEELTNLK